MGRSPDRTENDVALEAAAARIIGEMRLMRALGDAADRAHERYGCTQLRLDRSRSEDSVEIRAMIGDIVEIDLWHLDPLLWDETNAAAMQFVPEGQTSTVYPAHRDRDQSAD
jgi:hypothetical protein